jgi:hypothetical protein
MNIKQLTKDLLPIVKTSRVIADDNLDKIKNMSSMKLAGLKAQLDGNDVGDLNLYKIAYLHGKNRFRKMAENAIIMNGIKKLAALTEAEMDLIDYPSTNLPKMATPNTNVLDGNDEARHCSCGPEESCDVCCNEEDELSGIF